MKLILEPFVRHTFVPFSSDITFVDSDIFPRQLAPYVVRFRMVAVLLIALLILWRTKGGLPLACAMWVLAFLYMRRLPPRLKGLPVAWLAVLLGMLCNAVVTVANGGFMPVTGLPSGFRPLFPTWTPARPANYLVILADQHHLFYFSIGDVLIISGALLGL